MTTKCERHDNDDGSHEDHELQHIGDHDGPQTANRCVQYYSKSQRDNGEIDGNTTGNIQQFSYGIKKCSCVAERKEQDEISIILLYFFSEPLADKFSGGEYPRVLPSWSDEHADEESANAHGPLDGDCHKSILIRDRSPDHKGSGRKKTHE